MLQVYIIQLCVLSPLEKQKICQIFTKQFRNSAPKHRHISNQTLKYKCWVLHNIACLEQVRKFTIVFKVPPDQDPTRMEHDGTSPMSPW